MYNNKELSEVIADNQLIPLCIHQPENILVVPNPLKSLIYNLLAKSRMNMDSISIKLFNPNFSKEIKILLSLHRSLIQINIKLPATNSLIYLPSNAFLNIKITEKLIAKPNTNDFIHIFSFSNRI